MTVAAPAAAYAQGFNAYKRDGDRAVCPYGIGTLQHRMWYNGWTTARAGPEARILRMMTVGR